MKRTSLPLPFSGFSLIVPLLANSIRLDGGFCISVPPSMAILPHTSISGVEQAAGRAAEEDDLKWLEHLFIHGLISPRDGCVEASPDGAKRARQSHPASARA
jgi:hypothetical protein